ncbi:MAG: hypothetical protein K6D57_04445 [Paludibacteraceae bacterium]|nr:hypothetical protein [Paludibacteraceae bacterium]
MAEKQTLISQFVDERLSEVVNDRQLNDIAIIRISFINQVIMEEKILYLPLKKKWYEMIESANLKYRKAAARGNR